MVNSPAVNHLNEEKTMEGKLLFGKYPIARMHCQEDHAGITIGFKDNVLAVLSVDRKQFSGDFARNNPAANFESFKELYVDSKKYFSQQGVDIETGQLKRVFSGLDEHSDDELSGFIPDINWAREFERFYYPSSFGTTTNIIGYGQGRELHTDDFAMSVYEGVSSYLLNGYPQQEEEVVPTGYFGGITRGSRVHNLQSGLKVNLEAPLTQNSPWPINISVIANEDYLPEEVLALNADIRAYISSNFDASLLPDPNIMHSFNIDLTQGKKLELETSYGAKIITAN